MALSIHAFKGFARHRPLSEIKRLFTAHTNHASTFVAKTVFSVCLRPIDVLDVDEGNVWQIKWSGGFSLMEMIDRTDMMRSRFQWLGLVVSIVVCFGVAALGSLATDPNIDGWYAALRKPSWNPPNWVFGPVWSMLYLLMAVAAWLVWRRRGFAGASLLPLVLFGVQLVLNGLWSVLFFGWHRPDLAFIEIVFLWSAILATMLAFRRVVPLAAALLVPYFLWVTFAAFLNFTIWSMNS